MTSLLFELSIPRHTNHSQALRLERVPSLAGSLRWLVSSILLYIIRRRYSGKRPNLERWYKVEYDKGLEVVDLLYWYIVMFMNKHSKYSGGRSHHRKSLIYEDERFLNTFIIVLFGIAVTILLWTRYCVHS